MTSLMCLTSFNHVSYDDLYFNCNALNWTDLVTLSYWFDNYYDETDKHV